MKTGYTLYERRYRYRESMLRLRSDSLTAIEEGFKTFILRRVELEVYIALNPMFRYILDPVRLDSGMPEIVKRMVSASSIAGVGPMASVAGVLADLICESMLESGASVAIAENGGEASIASSKPVSLEAYVGSDSVEYILFEVDPCDTPLGVASSSARHGGGVSFGIADLATVFAENSALADAAATKLCNLVDSRSRDTIEYALKMVYEIPGVRGCFIVVDGYIGCVGWNPRILGISRRSDGHTVSIHRSV
ncbi:MAG: UPF0280 family protein [Nitrososphaerota archaeon]|nr:UPF0280 family protein [Candidatus Bathyarchaeota archaeon]MCX8162109.1 UPF0280 family protein [Candidatus Bathyarchaeota archaeon]MDW8061525.1 UPF0280 family protein [Nitrososphaerota archaeon]